MFIPVTSYPEQSFRIVLDGVPLRVRVYWSEYEESTRAIVGDDIAGQWYIDLNDDAGGIAINGAALVMGADILGPYAYDQLGALWLLDTGETGADPGQTDMGERHKIVYVPIDEVESFHADIGWTR